MNMYKEQLLEGIKLMGQHPYFTKQSLEIQVNIYFVGGLINQVEKDELLAVINPVIEETQTI